MSVYNNAVGTEAKFHVVNLGVIVCVVCLDRDKNLAAVPFSGMLRFRRKLNSFVDTSANREGNTTDGENCEWRKWLFIHISSC